MTVNSKVTNFFNWLNAVDTGDFREVLDKEIRELKNDSIGGHFVGTAGKDIETLAGLIEMILIRYATNRGKTRKELDQEINIAVLKAMGRGL
mgnify:CR=1 FL=1